MAGALALATVICLVPARAAPTDHPDDYLWLAWGDQPGNLEWVPGSSATALGSFIGSSVIVPGDRLERTLQVRNGGPSEALATVRIDHIALTGPTGNAAHELASLVHLTWQIGGQSSSMTWHDALQKDPIMASQITVAQDEVFAVTVGLYFPVEATGGRDYTGATHQLSFDVQITLTEKTDAKEPIPDVDANTGGTVVPRLDARMVAYLAVAGLIWLLWLGRRRALNQSKSE